MEKNCSVCGSLFKIYWNRVKTAKYCSIKCKAEKQRNTPKEKQGAWKGGRHKMPSGYIRVRENGKYYYEHRLIAEKKILKRKLKKNEVVHHIDGNRENNSVKNLVVMIKNEHDRLHTKRRWKKGKF